MRDLELLAPARNVDIGIAAIDCGADAVYIAGPAFGARQAAGNDVAQVRRLCDYAHKFGARVFVTLNTILYDEELEEAERLLEEVREAGADAVIVQDMAVLGFLSRDASRAGATRGQAPIRLPLHASTQCAIRSPQKAAGLEKLGFSRLILERELSLSQIRDIAAAVSCEIECFVHGALCVCYSGQCYMSELISGRSANRGACIQACRSRYDLVDGNGKTLIRDKALLSLKDLNLKSRLLDLAVAGVTSFKIEGRLKNVSYVRNVVREYSLALDAIAKQSRGKYRRSSFGRVRRGFTPDVNKTFNRGYTELFIDGRRGSWSCMDAAKSMGEELGAVVNISPDCSSFTLRPRSKAGTPVVSGHGEAGTPAVSGHGEAGTSAATGRGEVRLANGDGLSFVGRNGEVAGVRVDVASGLNVKCKRTPELYNGARIYRNFDSAFEKQMGANPCLRLIDVTISAHFTHSATESTPAPAGSLTVTAETEDGRRITKAYTGLWNEFATNAQRMRSMFATQLSKSSDIFQFNFTGLTTDTGEEERLPLLSAAALNSIRNDIAATLVATPFNARPLYIANPAVSCQSLVTRPSSPGADAVPAPSTDAASSPGADAVHAPSVNLAADLTGATEKSLTYKDNVANKLAEEILGRAGFNVNEPAFELTHRPGAELMRTKYCIRHELGLCPHQRPTLSPVKTTSSKLVSTETASTPAEPLYLTNNGRRLTLLFDCPRCEMIIT